MKSKFAKIEGLVKIWMTRGKASVQAKKVQEELIILGNGPSLKKDFEIALKCKGKMDVLGVNYFAGTQEYEKIQPTHYVINSLIYWSDKQREDWGSDRQKLFQDIVEKTTWKMNLFVPVKAKKDAAWMKMMGTNKNVQLNFFHQAPLDEYPSFFKNHLRKYKACPRPHNVLIPSILIGINLAYQKIYLFGADHSWIPEVFVTNDNVVMIGQKHFYSDQFKERSNLLYDNAKPMYNDERSEHKKLHEVLQKFYYSFKSYWFLKEYAEISNCQIFNLTEGSFIDAFEKLDANEIAG